MAGIGRRRDVAAASMAATAAAFGLAGWLAACTPRDQGPAPVVYAVMPAGGGGLAGRVVRASPPGQVVVRRGDSLAGIARRYGVSPSALAEANRLAPPYRLEAGRVLVIPAPARAPSAPVAVAALPPSGERPVPAAGKPAPLVPRGQSTRSASETPPRPSVAPPPPPRIASARASAGRASASPRPPVPAARSPEPHPKAPEEARRDDRVAPAAVEKHAAQAAHRPAAAPEKPESREAAHHGERFLWPVRGHILEGFGPGPNGTHNDGINIAAPRGAPVEAVQSGVVAYAGNELRGYGNLILIKHPKGWISAYAHCDLLLVKRGQKVSRGQVIARVGSTGNVGEPQLHFELRRGRQPIDPRPFLGPQPTAAAVSSARG